MANKMLIDASHPEETRVVVLRGNRVEEFDFEAASKKQLRGNIYLAKVMRVEPSLQAAFVDYGGNRHGFLAFSEIHPDYYQIPVADRQALIEEETNAQNEEEEEVSRPPRRSRRYRRDRHGYRADKRNSSDQSLSEPYPSGAVSDTEASIAEADVPAPVPVEDFGFSEDHPAKGEEATAHLVTPAEAPGLAQPQATNDDAGGQETLAESAPPDAEPDVPASPPQTDLASAESTTEPETTLEIAFSDEAPSGTQEDRTRPVPDDETAEEEEEEEEDESGEIEQLGGDAMEEMPQRLHRPRRQYKIQEVIKRRQVLLVQVVKEERGNKGAALTTYLSLAGRYSVLMPNTARGGGISRKITDSADRQRLKSIAQELDVPEGMGVILRTAGASRTKAEVKRDFEYLLRMWETVRETTLQSSAPTLVYEEGSLIKRAIRDLYNKDIDEIVVAGESGYREAKEFMRLLMPSHAKMVQPYRDPQPMFAKYGAEAQLDAMFSNQVTLRSGGYIVINQTEALVAIDVNSGRATREHNIEDTALRTNLEAADEIARQLRLRDLAGLIVIDFIDMEENRNNRTVERRLKDALKNDRARIQVGRMSHFGLLEMSRQRMRTGVLEGSTVTCPHCTGAGMVRSTSSIALHVLRALEDALMKNSLYDIIVKARTTVALYILNQKRTHLQELEKRFGVSLTIADDDGLSGTNYYALERGEPAVGVQELPASPTAETSIATARTELAFEGTEAEDEELSASHQLEEANEAAAGQRDGEAEGEGRQRRRRRRRRSRGGDRESSGITMNAPQPPDDALEALAHLNGLPASSDLESSEPESQRFDFSVADEAVAEPRISSRRPRRGEPSALELPLPPEPDTSVADTEFAAGDEAEATAAQGAVTNERRPRGGRRSRRGPRGGAALETTPPSHAAEVSAQEDTKAATYDGEVEGEGPSTASLEGAEERTPPAPLSPSGRKAQPDEVLPAEPEATPSPTVHEPARPKRSGWWQRARATGRG